MHALRVNVQWRRQKEIENKALVYIRYNEKTVHRRTLHSPFSTQRKDVLPRLKDVATNVLHTTIYYYETSFNSNACFCFV